MLPELNAVKSNLHQREFVIAVETRRKWRGGGGGGGIVDQCLNMPLKCLTLGVKQLPEQKPRKHFFFILSRSAYNRLKKQPEEPLECERVEVPRDLKGRVIGKGGCLIKEIMKSSGALIRSARKDDDWFLVSGDAEQRACARKLILEKEVSC